MTKKGQIQRRYSSEFKICVIKDMGEHHLNYIEVVRKYWDINQGQEHNYHKQVQRWERKYLEDNILKKLSALVLAEEQRKSKKRS